ncbi:MAG: glycerophosphodiester phosphodiesterase family protein, partial [Myxococcaceae bacterium]
MELVAFRGANWHFPEDTLPAFRRALQDGASVLEMDLHLTKDGVIVVYHDSAWHGKKITKTRYESLASKVPSLEEVLVAFPTTKLSIKIRSKDLKAVYLTVDMIRKHQASSRVCLASYYLEVHRWLDDLGYEGERGLSYLELLGVFLLPLAWLREFNLSGKRAQVPLKIGLLKFSSAYFV